VIGVAFEQGVSQLDHPRDPLVGDSVVDRAVLATSLDEAAPTQAGEVVGDLGLRPWFAHTQHDYARMLLRRGAPDDESRAGELLQAARSGYKELGMTAWQADATADLAGLA
jgi:hypothetical protein